MNLNHLFFGVALFVCAHSQGTLPANELQALETLSSVWPTAISCSTDCTLCTSWSGVQYCTSSGSVQAIEIQDQALTGTIPTVIGEFSQMQYLYMYSNNLSGTIPSQIGTLSLLQTLYLSDNKLTGEIPSQIQNLPLTSCNVWFGNELTCDPNYPSGITRCMGTQSEYDYGGDAPTCPPLTGTSSTSSTSSTIPSTSSTSSTIPSTSSTSSSSPASSTHVVSYTITWIKFTNPTLVRLQYQSLSSKGGWIAITVGNTQTTYTFTGLPPSTKYEYRLVVKTKTATTTSATYTFTTPAS